MDMLHYGRHWDFCAMEHKSIGLFSHFLLIFSLVHLNCFGCFVDDSSFYQSRLGRITVSRKSDFPISRRVSWELCGRISECSGVAPDCKARSRHFCLIQSLSRFFMPPHKMKIILLSHPNKNTNEFSLENKRLRLHNSHQLQVSSSCRCQRSEQSAFYDFIRLKGRRTGCTKEENKHWIGFRIMKLNMKPPPHLLSSGNPSGSVGVSTFSVVIDDEDCTCTTQEIIHRQFFGLLDFSHTFLICHAQVKALSKTIVNNKYLCSPMSKWCVRPNWTTWWGISHGACALMDEAVYLDFTWVGCLTSVAPCESWWLTSSPCLSSSWISPSNLLSVDARVSLIISWVIPGNQTHRLVNCRGERWWSHVCQNLSEFQFRSNPVSVGVNYRRVTIYTISQVFILSQTCQQKDQTSSRLTIVNAPSW